VSCLYLFSYLLLQICCVSTVLARVVDSLPDSRRSIKTGISRNWLILNSPPKRKVLSSNLNGATIYSQSGIFVLRFCCTKIKFSIEIHIATGTKELHNAIVPYLISILLLSYTTETLWAFRNEVDNAERFCANWLPSSHVISPHLPHSTNGVPGFSVYSCSQSSRSFAVNTSSANCSNTFAIRSQLMHSQNREPVHLVIISPLQFLQLSRLPLSTGQPHTGSPPTNRRRMPLETR
jgi:hypothetical protein